ncbi:MAG: hypothetical protein IH840_02150 [Candidatus Heimdallarchaeota archaeon]|nr:hypothetical protein [Candidatus Heimdallarchaeota archaeon]
MKCMGCGDVHHVIYKSHGSELNFRNFLRDPKIVKVGLVNPDNWDENVIPKELREDLAETYSCNSLNLYNATASMGRRALQRICLIKEIPKNDLVVQLTTLLKDYPKHLSDYEQLSDGSGMQVLILTLILM